jgi:hypothetical protein
VRRDQSFPIGKIRASDQKATAGDAIGDFGVAAPPVTADGAGEK